MLKLLAHLNAFRELLTCGPRHSTPKAFAASSGKRHLRASLPLTPLSGTPRRTCRRWQKR